MREIAKPNRGVKKSTNNCHRKIKKNITPSFYARLLGISRSTYYAHLTSINVNVNIRMYNFDDVQCTVIPSVAYGFVTGMNLQLC